MTTAAAFREQTSKDLAKLAKSKGVQGWHSMKKEQLVKALVKVAKQKSMTKSSAKSPVAKSKTKPSTSTSAKVRVTKPKVTAKATKAKSAAAKAREESKIAKKIRRERMKQESLRDLAEINKHKTTTKIPEEDRVILVVRDPYWIQAYWEITKTTVERARVAMSMLWHDAKPVIRLLKVSEDSSSSVVEDVVRETTIHGGVRNWFIDVPETQKQYRVALGYLTTCGKFHLIAKSNTVCPPPPNSESAFDHNWADITEDFKKYYAASGGYETNSVGELQNVFEDKLRRPMHQAAFVRLGSGVANHNRQLNFEVDAHMVIQGSADPTANVTLAGEPVRLGDDGSFTIRMHLPDRRQVLPIVASSRDGTQQRTTVLAIERNTKVMEPVTSDPNAP